MGGAFEGFPVVITQNATERLLTVLSRLCKAACCLALCYFLTLGLQLLLQKKSFCNFFGCGLFYSLRQDLIYPRVASNILIYYVAEEILELLTFVPPLPKCWGIDLCYYTWTYAVLEIEHKTSYVLAKHYDLSSNPSPTFTFH